MEKPEDSIEERYNKLYKVGNAEFFLSDYIPNIEECKFLLLKVVEQAVRDILAYKGTDDQELIDRAKEAYEFIFDDEYYIAWGDEEFNLQIILDFLDIDLEWFRDKTRTEMENRENGEE